MSRTATTLHGFAAAAAVFLAAGCGGGSGGSDAEAGPVNNQPPRAEIQASTEAVAGATQVLDGSASEDPDDEVVSYQWRVAAQPEGSDPALAGAADAEATFTPQTAGRYVLELAVTDQQGAVDTSRQPLWVHSRVDAYLPLGDLGPDRVVAVGERVEMDLAFDTDLGGPFARDPALEGVATNWSLAARPGGSAAALDSDRFTAAFTADAPGLYTVAVTLSHAGRQHRYQRNVVAAETRQGGLRRLPGAGGTPVGEATFYFDIPSGLDPAAVSRDDEAGVRVLRTEIDVEFEPEATVAQANAVLDEVAGGIVAMTANTNAMLIRVPDPGDLQGLNNLIATVEGLSGVAAVDRSVLVEPPREEWNDPEGDGGSVSAQALPGGINAGATPDMARTNHQLAVRGHGAWNMRGAIANSLNDRPWIVIADFFGDGQPDGDYAAVTRGGDFDNFSPDNDGQDCEDDESCAHGYHVLGIILGDYGPGPGGQARDDVTGVFPGVLRVRAVDMARNNNRARTRRRLVRRIQDVVNANGNDTRVVINTSIGGNDPAARAMNRHARRYARALRNNNLVDNVLHATAAGNTVTDNSGNTVRWPARRNSPYAYATLGDITGFLGADVDELDNILVVENRLVTGASSTSRPVPGCLNGGSLFSGNISGIGSGVWSFGRIISRNPDNSARASDSRGATNMNGTSMSTPQVAGVAAYAWAVDDSASGADLVQRMRALARSDYASGCATTPQGVVDALDVVRAAGGDARRALQDVAAGSGTAGSDGRFDFNDIDLTMSQFTAGASLDYGRFDLNGDGWTDGAMGSGRTEPVDLNADGARGAVQLDLAGFQRSFNESAATDLDVLCFDAYDSPYSGDTADRNRVLGQPCGIVDVTIQHPSAGDNFTEGDRIEVEAEITINGPHDGTASLLTGGSEVDSDPNWDHTNSFPVTLSTREVCPGDPSLTVRFDDAQTGLRAEDSVAVDIFGASLSAYIAGEKPRYVRVHPGPRIDPIPFTGKGSLPTCEDPLSERLDQRNLTWLDDRSSPLSSNVANIASPPTSMELLQDYLADGSGGFQQRQLRLQFQHDGRTVRDSVWVKPCSSDLGFGSAVAGYPECPTSAVAEDLVAGLESTFGVSTIEELNERIGQMINGVPDYRDVLDELGRQPCDPRYCDPFPPTFPRGSAELLESLTINEYDPVAIDHLERMFAELDEASGPGDARQRLQGIMENVRADTEAEVLGSTGRDLVQGAYSVTVTTLDHFAPVADGGSNGWASFMTDEQQARLHSEGDRIQPARQALAGYLTAVNDGNVRSEFADSELARNGAEYGAAIGAGQSYLALDRE